MESSAKRIYCFLGLPASGKGTQAENFAKQRGLEIIGIGKLVRDEIESNPLDAETIKIKAKYDEGIPQDDQVVFDLIKKKIQSLNTGVVFDNFPFSKRQADLLNEFVEESNWETPVIIYIKIDQKTSIKRITKRRVCSECGAIFNEELDKCSKCGGSLEVRSDDNEETVKNRLKFYVPRIKEVIDIYSNDGKIITIDGEPSIETVTKAVNAIA